MLEDIIEILIISNDVSWTEVESVVSEIIKKKIIVLGQKRNQSISWGKNDLRENIFLPGGGAGLAEKFKGVKERYVSAEARFGANKGAKLADPMHGVPDDVLVMVL